MGGDDVDALEAAVADTWAWARTLSRTAARALDPRLDPTAYPMVALIGSRGALRPSEMSAALQLDRSTVSRQIDAAARLGLVERVPDPADARAVIVRFTPETRARMDALRAAHKERWRAALATWDPRDITELTRLLGMLSKVELS